MRLSSLFLIFLFTRVSCTNGIWNSRSLTKRGRANWLLPLRSTPHSSRGPHIAILEYTLVSETIHSLAKPYGCSRAIVAANSLVLLAWHATKNPQQMTRHFILHGNPRKHREYGRILSAFSHIQWTHFANNMGALMVFGPKLEQLLGRQCFSYFYAASIYASSVFSSSSKHGSLGASGAISALEAYYCLRFPRDRFRIEGVDEPVPAVVIPICSLFLDLFFQTDSKINYAAHIGGYFFGFAVIGLENILGGRRIEQLWWLSGRRIERLSRRFTKWYDQKLFKMEFEANYRKDLFSSLVCNLTRARKAVQRWKTGLENKVRTVLGTQSVLVLQTLLSVSIRAALYIKFVVGAEN